MRKSPVKILLLAASIASSVLSAASAGVRCEARSGARSVPLVELYTSEGCSSCPPADRWLSRQVRRTDANWLAFHVDYWDDIGWPDRFASPDYSRRQRERVAAGGGSTVYTPQVMVGTDVRAAWQTSDALAQVIARQSVPAPVGLALRIETAAGGDAIHLGAAMAPDATASAIGARVWLAAYLDGQTTQVRAGENRGASLHHDHVVRELWGPWPLGATPLSRTERFPALDGRWGLVAFAQDRDGRTLQSLALAGRTCD